MRMGIFGGSFDPVHFGHLLLAEQCREQCRLDEVWFLPAANPPHKQGASLALGNQRAEMLEFATAGHPEFVVNRMELDRGGTSYTVETLSLLHEQDTERELYLLIGADSLRDFATWREPDRISELAVVVAVNRGDRPLPDLASLNDSLGEKTISRIQFVTMPGIDLSATDIRQRVAEGRSIRYMVPRSVETYIHEKGLYRAS